MRVFTPVTGPSSLPAKRSRSSRRNMNFYDGSPDAYLGGVIQNSSITNANSFYVLIDILLIVARIISIHFKGIRQLMLINTERLIEGYYDISCPRGECTVIKFARASRATTCLLTRHNIPPKYASTFCFSRGLSNFNLNHRT
jgi:hypothetical protein